MNGIPILALGITPGSYACRYRAPTAADTGWVAQARSPDPKHPVVTRYRRDLGAVLSAGMRVLGVVCALAMVAGCSDSRQPVATPVESTDQLLARFGFERCEDFASTGVVDGVVSADPEIAAAQQWRADMGFRSDMQWVEEVAAMEGRRETDDSFAYPLTRNEVDELGSRGAGVEGEELKTYGQQFPETFGSVWLDNTVRSWTISFTDDVELRRLEIEDRFPGVRVAPARFSGIELGALNREMSTQVLERDLGTQTFQYVQYRGGMVGLALSVLNESTITAVSEFADPELVCVTGQDPSRYTPPGPQLDSGEGWRLLGLREVDMEFEAYFDIGSFRSAWQEFSPDEQPPPVDFADEIVVSIPTRGRGVENGPCGTRFDGWSFDGDKARFDVPTPGGDAVCPAVHIPGAYFIAIDRTGLPPDGFDANVVNKQSDGAVQSRRFRP